MVLDIIFVAIVALSVMICFKCGFTRSLFNMFSAVLGVLAAILFYDKFVSLVKGSKYGIMFTDKIESTVLNHYRGSTDAAINNSEIPGFLKSFMQDGAKTFESAVAEFSQKVSGICITVVAIILLIIIIKLALLFVPKLLKAVCKLPVIKQFDKLSGAVFGIISGIIWCVIIAYICTFLADVPQFSIIKQQLETSFFLMLI